MQKQDFPYILVINPGSTSTKLGYFYGTKAKESISVNHLKDPEWPKLTPEERFRRRLTAAREFIRGKKIDMIMARGGLLKPLPSGIYIINEAMLRDLKNAPRRHASNLAAPIAKIIADELGVPAYVADPVTTDELNDIARYSGHPAFPRISIFHALNHKATARKFAASQGKKYEDLHLIVVHMGGGISVGAHKKGKVTDVNQALDGDGPFSPERSGSLPAGDLVRAAFSGQYARDELLKMITGEGGLKAYTGTADVKSLLQRGNPDDLKAVDAMLYQTAQQTAAMAVALDGKIDAILLTGGLARSDYVINRLKQHLHFLGAPIHVFPGENEMEALAYNGMLVWEGKQKPIPYS